MFKLGFVAKFYIVLHAIQRFVPFHGTLMNKKERNKIND